MATKRQQTMAKRAREQAVKEKRDRKVQRKAERLAAAEAGETVPMDGNELDMGEIEANPDPTGVFQSS